MNPDELLESLLDEFGALAHPQKQDLESLLVRAPQGYEGELCWRMVVEAIRGAAAASTPRWIDDFLSTALWTHRRIVTRHLSAALFANDGELAEQLGLRELGAFRLTQVLGFGGFATTFLAHSADDPSTSLVVKVSHRQPQAARTRLAYEEEILGDLPPHPALPVLVDAKPLREHWPFLVYQFLPGAPLSDWLSTNPGVISRLAAAEQLATVLRHLQDSKGFVHGDLSPENILVDTSDGKVQVRLLDFGEAKRRFLGADGHPSGALFYTAPELLNGNVHNATASTDLWSLGAVIFICLAGEHPFGPLSATLELAAWCHRVSQEPITKLPERFGIHLQELVDRSLHPDPNYRRVLIGDLSTALQQTAASPAVQRAVRYEQLLTTYLDKLVRKFDEFQLPLVDEQMVRPIPLETLYIDLPLRIDREVDERPALDFVENFAAQFQRSKKRSDDPDRELETTADQRLTKNKSAVIVGAPGSGKSTILAAHIVRRAKTQLACSPPVSPPKDKGEPAHDSISPLPVVLVCRDLIKATLSSLDDLVLKQLKKWGFGSDDRRLLADQLLTSLADGRATLFVDGLDELPTEELRRQFCELLVEREKLASTCFFATSREQGFKEVKDLFQATDLLTVDTLVPAQHQAYLDKWCELDGRATRRLLQTEVLEPLALATLCENMLTYSLLLQLSTLEPNLPKRRVDVFERVVNAMLERQRVVAGEPRLTANEVLPHLEYFAFQMRQQELREQSLPDHEVWQIFQDLRTAEPKELQLLRRPTDALLNAIVDYTGLLQVGGPSKPVNGRQRHQIQFFHQLFQEYFAGRAIVYGRGGLSGTLTERIRNLVFGAGGQPPCVSVRIIKSLRKGTRHEPSLAERWQVALALGLSALEEEESTDIEEVLRALMPTEGNADDLRRARSVLALQMLSDNPYVAESLVGDIVTAAIRVARAEDGIDNNENTLLDIALEAAKRSRYGGIVQERLLHAVIAARGDQQFRIATFSMPKLSSRHEIDFERRATSARKRFLTSNECGQLAAALELLAVCYTLQESNRIEELSADTREQLAEWLLETSATCPSQPARMVLIWAFYWLIGAAFNKPRGVSWLNRDQEERLLEVFERLEDNDPALGMVAMILSCREGKTHVAADSDWIYEWAVVADGEKPQQQLPKPKSSGRQQVAEALRQGLLRATSSRGVSRIAIALGRMGEFLEAISQPLLELFLNDIANDAERDEAITYAAQVCPPTIFFELMENLPIDFEDEFVCVRIALPLLAIGDPSSLRTGLLGKHISLRTAFAYGLAGIADPTGRQILRELQDHPDESICKAAEAGLTKAKSWGLD